MKKLTPKQESFAQHYAIHGNASEAYRVSYDASKSSEKTITTRGYELTINPNVEHRIKQLRKETEKKYEKTRDAIVSDLVEIIDTYKLTGQLTPNALKAIEIFNKMMGYNEPDKVEHTGLIINIVKPI